MNPYDVKLTPFLQVVAACAAGATMERLRILTGHSKANVRRLIQAARDLGCQIECRRNLRTYTYFATDLGIFREGLAHQVFLASQRRMQRRRAKLGITSGARSGATAASTTL